MMNKTRAKLHVKKLLHLNDREARIATANPIKMRSRLLSNGFPSCKFTTQSCPVNAPSHCDGRRDPAMHIQIMGTHKAVDVPRTLAGSRHINARRRVNQRQRAIGGGM